MRWGRRGDEDLRSDDDTEVVERRLRWVAGSAPGVYALDEPSPAPEVDPVDPVDPADPVAARRALAAFDPGRRGVKVLAVVAAVVVVVVGFLVWRARPRPVVVTPPAATGVGPSAGQPAPTVSGIVVAVAGRVHRPGLVRLPFGARVADAIEAAGGVLPGTDLGQLNLARKLIDGELLVVGASPVPGPAGGAPGAGAAPGAPQPGAPLNLNTATVTDLDALPGVGPVLAQRIVDYRTRNGGFRSVDELRKVEGFGDARLAQLKDLVTV
jgi:competence protein ComEA